MPLVDEFGGQKLVRHNGRWVEASDEESEILRGDPRAVAFKTAVSELYGLGNLAAGLMMPPGRHNFTNIGPELMGAGAEHFAAAAQLAELRPGPAQAGRTLVELLSALPVARGGSAAQRVRSAMTGRPAGDIAAEAAVDRAFGATSVGAAQSGEVRGMGRFFRNITDQLDEPRRLSADQFDVLDSGLADEVGFEFPPMSLNNEQTFASILSNPLLNREIVPVLFRNTTELGNKFAAAVGLSPADFPRGAGRGMVGAARQRFRTEFGAIARELGDDIQLAGVNVDDMAPFMRREQRQLLRQGEPISGDQLMTLRSQLNNNALPGAWRQGDTIQVNIIEDAIEDIDKIITDRLTGPALTRWREIQEQWRTFMVTKRPGVIDLETGELSLKSLTRNLEKQYPDFAQTGPAQLGELTFRNEGTGELLKFARVARSFADSLADSGTPTRSLMTALATNPKQVPKFIALRHAIDDIAITPQQALDLAR